MSKSFDRYAGIVFLAMGAGFAAESTRISESAYGSNVGANMFPLILGIILIVLSIRLIVETFRYKQETNTKEKLDYKRFLIIFTAAVLYGLFIEQLGYVISTFLFLLVGFQTMERGKIWITLLIAGGFSFGVYYLFVEVMDGTLPGLPAWLGLS
ncbi:tripartite tricarboxylate transporter TctB family protein [Paenibacillus silviterrae]|uniref:tripartite tricarboxylate transporter TctB family protein n=1 Tax=Paenibacillus silviterrae TaxID=3242194 RepID=UPI00254271C5|nr:tripartite tricarboxylate transporter TctB family protein [Paenibacillus chinjuensis]